MAYGNPTKVGQKAVQSKKFKKKIHGHVPLKKPNVSDDPFADLIILGAEVKKADPGSQQKPKENTELKTDAIEESSVAELAIQEPEKWLAARKQDLRRLAHAEIKGKSKNDVAEIPFEFDLQDAEKHLEQIFIGNHPKIKLSVAKGSKVGLRNIMTDLTKILSTGVGRDLINSITEANHVVEIADSGVSSPLDAQLQPWINKQELYAGYAKSYNTDYEITSKGIGARSTVSYRGNQLVRDKKQDIELFRSDVVLFHELVHASHTSNGQLYAPKLTVNKLPNHLQPTVKNGQILLFDVQNHVYMEEWATVGLGPWAKDRLTENAYRAARREAVANDDNIDDQRRAELLAMLAPRTTYTIIPSSNILDKV